MKLFITGANGFLGYRVSSYFQSNPNYEVISKGHHEFDFTKEKQVETFFRKENPDIVIHCGAISDIHRCEENPSYAYHINVYGTRLLAQACSLYGARLIFCSSDQVYTGLSNEMLHTEEEELSPIHHYGRQKLEAEQICLNYSKNNINLRLSWMYDVTIRKAEHATLFSAIRQTIEDKKVISYPIYDYRSITNVWEVVKNIEKVFVISGGTYNFGSENSYNTYEVVKQIFQKLGYEQQYLIENKEAFFKKPRNLCMNIEKIKKEKIFFYSTIDGIWKIDNI